MDNFTHDIRYLFHCKYTKYQLYGIISIKKIGEKRSTPLLHLHKLHHLVIFVYGSMTWAKQRNRIAPYSLNSSLLYFQCKEIHLNGVQTKFKCKLNVKRCKRFVFPPSSLLPHFNALKTKAIDYFQTVRTLTRIVSPPLQMEKFGRRYNPCGEMYTDANGKKYYYDDQTDNYLQKNYQLLFNHTFSTAWNLNVALHYTKGDGYYEEYKDGRYLIEYGLKSFTIDGTEVSKSDLVRQKKMDNKFGGGVFSLNYMANRLNASLGGGLNQYRGNNFGRVPWVKNYVGSLSPDHEYYRNKSKKTDGNIYLKANYDLTRGLSAYADLQYRHINYTIDGNNDKYDWSKNALRPLAVDKKFDFFNPKVGLNWNITSNHRVYSSFSVAQKEPTRNNYTDGDPDSYPKAEKLLDYEAGYTFANQWLTAGANFYYMDYTDQLVLTGALNDIGEALTENVPDSYRMGIEIMLGIKPCKWFQWDINATWSKNRIQDFVESLPGYHYNDDGSSTSLPTIQIKHKDTHIAFSPDFLLNNRFSFNYKGFEAALQSQFVSKQYMTNAEVEELTLDKYFVSNLNLAYSFRPKKVLKEVTIGFTVYNLFNEKYENNGWASSDYTDTLENRGNYAGYAAQAGTNVMGHVSFRF